ncbi:MAG: glutamate mutase L [Litorilinea sp.]
MTTPDEQFQAHRDAPHRAEGRRADGRRAEGRGAFSDMTTQGTLLAFGVEADRLRACLLESVSGRYRLVAWLGARRQSQLSMAEQATALCREMGRRLGRVLWDDGAQMPLLTSEYSARIPPIEQLAVALTPLPCLRVAVLGLTARLSTELGQQAVRGGPTEVVAADYLTHRHTAQILAEQWRTRRVDAVLLAGGYDALPAPRHPQLFAMLTYAVHALQMIPAAQRPVVYFAGSAWAGVQAERLLHSGTDRKPVILPNIMPNPTFVRQNIVAQALHTLYARRAQQTPGYAELAAWSNSGQPPTTLESNFARLIRAWRDLHGLDDLHGLYVSSGHRVHVWSSAREETVQLHYARDSQPVDLPDWPPVQLLSGNPGGNSNAKQADGRVPGTVRWWDRGGIGPLLTALGASAPLAVRQVLEHDVLRVMRDAPRGTRPQLMG